MKKIIKNKFAANCYCVAFYLLLKNKIQKIKVRKDWHAFSFTKNNNVVHFKKDKQIESLNWLFPLIFLGNLEIIHRNKFDAKQLHK